MLGELGPGLGPGTWEAQRSTAGCAHTFRVTLHVTLSFQVLLDSVLLIAAEDPFAPLRTQQSHKPIAGAKSHARVAPLLQRKALPHT